MCGIAGLFLPKGAPAVTPDMERMLGAIAHRGPNDRRIHRSADGRFMAGFVRLAIIDLEGGGQPLVDEATRTTFLGNGEIYNFVELRRPLEEVGVIFHTHGDMEVGLRLYQAKGTGFVHDLNGMFGLAVHDGDRDRLVLVRDRLGIKPLYWARLEGGGILFASEVKALFASGLVRAEVDEARLPEWFAHGYVPAPATLWKGVNKLAPGHLLVAGGEGGVTVERWWRPRPDRDYASLDEGEAARHLTALLEDSVRLQLRSDVPVGALLSGGVDSGLMVALAARQLDRPLNTYTVRFAGAPVDESPLAGLVAERYGTRHTVFDLPTTTAADWLVKLAWYCDEPLFDASLLPNHLINAVLGREMRVVLNGSGGDELFAGYGRYFQTNVERRYQMLPGVLRRRLIEPAVGLLSPLRRWQLARAAEFDGDRGQYLHDHTTQFPPSLRRLLGVAGEAGRSAQSRFFTEFDGPAQSGALYADLLSYLPEDLLLLLDRTTMAASVEGRVPFLDHRMVEAALAISPAIRTPGGRQKALERAMAAPLLPAAILEAPKQGFASPVPAWFRDGLALPARRLLTRPATLARGWWSRAGVEALLADPVRHAFRLYAMVMLELTVRLYVEHEAVSLPSASLEDMADAA